MNHEFFFFLRSKMNHELAACYLCYNFYSLSKGNGAFYFGSFLSMGLLVFCAAYIKFLILSFGMCMCLFMSGFIFMFEELVYFVHSLMRMKP